MDLGVLLSLPLESVALRAVIAALVAIACIRLLLWFGLRAPSTRVATALAPALALSVVVVLSGTSLQLPALMLPVDGAGGLPIPVGEGFVYFAPLAVPLLVGAWLAVAGIRLSRRVLAQHRIRRRARHARLQGTPVPDISALATEVARRLKVATPSVIVLPRVQGGAVVVGGRRPLVLLDRCLLARFDTEELEAVLAHELAHVRRHDNLVALLLGIVRDLTFFVPGGGWAVRQLHRERELAADQVAVSVTGRPGALASGLLKVLESGSHAHQPCAAFAPRGSLVERVRILVDDQPPVSVLRRVSESIAVVGVVALATVLALVLPTVVAGAERQRDAMALVWASSPSVSAGAGPSTTAEARAFEVYRRSTPAVAPSASVAPSRFDEHGAENRRSTLRACGVDETACPTSDARVALDLRPQVRVDHELSWEATPVVDRTPSDGLQLFWLARLQ